MGVNVIGIIDGLNSLLKANVPGYKEKVEAAEAKAKSVAQPVVNTVAESAIKSTLKKYWWLLALIPVAVVTLIFIFKKKRRK